VNFFKEGAAFDDEEEECDLAMRHRK